MSVFERLGGKEAINQAVDIFYRKVLADETVNHFFENTDMRRQAAKQKAFLTFAFGGPNNYTGKNLREAHKHLVEDGLNDTHFDTIVSHLATTLEELGATEEDIKEVADVAESVREDVLNR